jgi:competence protein ComGC
MNWKAVYRVLLGVGALVIIASLFMPTTYLTIMVVIGILVILFSLAELIMISREGRKEQPLLKSKPHPSFKQQSDISKQHLNESTIAHKVNTPQEKKEKKPSFWSTVLKKKQPQQPINVKAIKGIKETKNPQKKTQEVAVIKGKPQDDKKKGTLEAFILDALKKGFSRTQVKEAALKANWPKDIFDKTYKEIIKHRMMKRLIKHSIALVVVIIFIAVLVTQDMFLLPYWITTLKYASPLFYVGALLFILAIIAIFIAKVRKMVKRKTVVHSEEEEKVVKEIETQIQTGSGAYETDLDKLYKLLEQRKKVRVNEVARAFKVSKKDAEEWGKILKEQNLAEIFYPAVGDMEIRWKESSHTKQK